VTVALLILAGVVALDTLLMVGRVGKPRDPVTPAMAVLAVIQYGTVAGMLVWAAVIR
jgi:hypothetical protein